MKINYFFIRYFLQTKNVHDLFYEIYQILFFQKKKIIYFITVYVEQFKVMFLHFRI